MHGARVAKLLLSFCFLMHARIVAAQQSARRSLPPLELRVDVIDARSPRVGTLHGGLGVNVPLGYYARFEIDGAGGIARRDSIDRTTGRVDALARFLLDPFAESPWGFSIGGGVSAMFGKGTPAHQYLVVVADLEGPRVGSIVPALQIGLGGGVRVGLLTRTYQRGRR